MNNLVKKHYDKDDIERQFINKDILLWKEEVDCINAEIVFFKQLLKNKKNNDIYSKIIEKLETKEKENNILLANLIFYIRKTDGLKECEDIECETYYLNDHILFKNNIESFLFQYKKLKRLAYLKINEQNNLT
ncbi:hypothetical protein LXD69_07705 [Flavobacterium sediminilitoris]|uniref:Uncharacterized protein n=1 Tax=Flavobacterium sediminilitoris TaxID=2024526 RepID=A0ABY4HRR9_9FLAO|nr:MULTISPECIES: hypothetical protein [Flavobacterium]UOX35395.1 hypothetical protein LXD69_07705 [Flavobacterium sediminilitoris]